MKKFCSILFIISSVAFANKPKIKLAVEEYPKYAKSDGTGIYLDIVREVLSEKYDVSFRFGPWPRLEKHLLKGKLDGFLVHDPDFLKAAFPDKKFIHPNVHLNLTEIYAIFKKGSFDKWDNNLLKTQTVSWMNGFNFQHTFGKGAKYKNSSEDESALKLLLKGRIGIYFSYWELTEKIKNEKFEDKELNGENLDYFLTPFTEFESLVMLDNPKNRKIIEIWDKNFEKLNASGKISKIYEREGEVFPYDTSKIQRLLNEEQNILKGEDLKNEVNGFYMIADYRSETILEVNGTDYKGAFIYDEGEGVRKGFFQGTLDYESGLGKGVICYENTSKWLGDGGILLTKTKGYSVLHLLYTEDKGDGNWKDDWQHKKVNKAPPSELRGLFAKHHGCV